MSRFTDVLLVSPLADGRTWVIQRDFGYDVGEEGSGDTIEVPEGFQTDFASVPSVAWPLIPRWGKYGKAAIVHDFMYWDQNKTRKESDDIFREAMGVLGVASWRRFLMYRAVRLVGGLSWRANRKRREQGKNRVRPAPSKADEAKTW
ncbi:MAG: DUF1353 domain-containing protein [Chloroflexi bacterium]|nr:DUF1353 domain-containing protein [Chloroflexota bacterium]